MEDLGLQDGQRKAQPEIIKRPQGSKWAIKALVCNFGVGGEKIGQAEVGT